MIANCMNLTSIEDKFYKFERIHIEIATSLIVQIRCLAKKLDREKYFEGYSWVKVKSFKFDKSKTFEQNLFDLKAHHCSEIFFLSAKIKELEGLLK